MVLAMTQEHQRQAAEALLPGLQYLQIEAARCRLPQVSSYIAESIDRILAWLSEETQNDRSS